MQCPKCQTVMREREKETGDVVVVMDVCPSCGGIWLDRGELEKLSQSENRYYQNARWDDDDDDDDDDRRRRQQYNSAPQNNAPPPGYQGQQGYGNQQPYPNRKKKGGFLGNIFEGFGGGDD